jgi:hypothetical protein
MVIVRPLSPLAGCVVVALSAVPAVLSYHYVEEPFRHSRVLVDLPRRAAVLAVVVTVAGVGAGVVLARTAPPTAFEVAVRHADGTVAQVKVDPSTARTDFPVPYGDDCHSGFGEEVPPRCVYGDTASDRRVALLGDSHAIQWFPALEPLAQQHGLALEVDTKSACSPADVLQFEKANLDRVYHECPTWRNTLLQQWTEDPTTRPDLVLVASRDLLTVMDGKNRLGSLASLQAQRDGLERTFARLQELGIEVIVIGDVLAPGFDEPNCLAENRHDPMTCSFAAAGAAPRLAADRDAAAASGVPVVDPNATMCPDGTCPPILDGVLVYRDSHHVTAAYASAFAPVLEEQLDKTAAWQALASP